MAGFEVIDATCPRVIKVQSIIRQRAGEGAAVIVTGDGKIGTPRWWGSSGTPGKEGGGGAGG